MHISFKKDNLFVPQNRKPIDHSIRRILVSFKKDKLFVSEKTNILLLKKDVLSFQKDKLFFSLNRQTFHHSRRMHISMTMS